MTWLVFYPRTMWRIVARPAVMMRYSDSEQTDAADQQYTDTLSPPLFLMLTLLISHGISLGVGTKGPEVKTAFAKALFESEQNMLIVESLLYSLFALVGATTVVKRRGLALDRRTLRGPFYGQCYLTAPLALALSGAGSMAAIGVPQAGVASAALALTGVAWYLWVQTTWYRRELGLGGGRAFGVAAWSVLKAVGYAFVVTLVLAKLSL
jgi:hypothetical protein